jgi:hypothetical protein
VRSGAPLSRPPRAVPRATCSAMPPASSLARANCSPQAFTTCAKSVLAVIQVRPASVPVSVPAAVRIEPGRGANQDASGAPAPPCRSHNRRAARRTPCTPLLHSQGDDSRRDSHRSRRSAAQLSPDTRSPSAFLRQRGCGAGEDSRRSGLRENRAPPSASPSHRRHKGSSVPPVGLLPYLKGQVSER